MTVNGLLNRVHLPSLVSYFGLGSRYTFFKIPAFGWYGNPMDNDYIFNAIDLFKANQSNMVKLPPEEVIQATYRFFTQDHKELLETPTAYSERTENDLISDYLYNLYFQSFYKKCRDEALNGNVKLNDKNHKFSKLLNSLNYDTFISSGVGLVTYRILADLKAKKIPIQERWCNKMLIPSFFSIDGRVSTLEICPIQDISSRERIYTNVEPGWYGRAGETLVGNVKDLLTINGCTWDRKLSYWGLDKAITLHHSLQTNQLLDMWSNSNGLVFDKNPLEILKQTQQLNSVKDHLKDLTLHQIRDLEKYTNESLYDYWIQQRYDEITISSIKFSCKDGRYYYKKGGTWQEFSNFSITLNKVIKEGEWYQTGQIFLNERETEFKIKRAVFASQLTLMQELTNVCLDAGLGIPQIAPNLKHYLPNVVHQFNTENKIEKPVKNEPAENTLVPEL